MKKAISTNGAPAAIGPYSQAIDCGEFVFTAASSVWTPPPVNWQTAAYRLRPRRL